MPSCCAEGPHEVATGRDAKLKWLAGAWKNPFSPMANPMVNQLWNQGQTS
jgi:hypothetical protein